ncbi:hypothetical protein [Neobacillus bataviensis]|uniref:hypothetical protein n=1 Tax=Neobacillus bataviensis TaxID=220685 RepID=UPI001CC0FA78|nr:hypothetical protein [Neobacillus bataviensis]
MRILLLLITIIFQATSTVFATSNIENIDLKLKDHEFAITFLGLSAGEATLIQGPNGGNILVNIGREESKEELEKWLSLYDVEEISTLILTNDEPETHINLINQFLLKYKTQEIITTPKMAAFLSKSLNPANQLSIVAWGEGTKKEILPELTAEVQFLGSMQNEGLDFTLEFFNHRIFMMNSFSKRAEQKLLTRNLENLNVFKTPLFAKEDAITEKLIEFFNPQISILFADEGDLFDTEIIHDLHDIWSEIYFTKKHGTVTIKFTDSNYEVIPLPAAAEE